jgi:hypothetical protein
MISNSPKPTFLDPQIVELKAFYPGVLPMDIQQGVALGARGFQVLRRPEGKEWTKCGTLPAPLSQRLAFHVPWYYQYKRYGIHILQKLKSGRILAATGNTLYYSDDENMAFHPVTGVGSFFEGPSYPLVEDSQGRVFFGQYILNRNRSQVIILWRSDDGGKNFNAVYQFEPGKVRHIHFVSEDSFDGSLWMGTGDVGEEPGMYRSTNGGESFEVIGQGSQQWRSTGIVFRPEGAYWGTDAGCDAGNYRNRIVRWNRSAGKLEKLMEVQGPVQGMTTTPNGGILMSTIVERGENETDDSVHFWYSPDGMTWKHFAAWQRGSQPDRVRYGRGMLVSNQHQSKDIYLVLHGIRGCAFGHMVARLLPEV